MAARAIVSCVMACACAGSPAEAPQIILDGPARVEVHTLGLVDTPIPVGLDGAPVGGVVWSATPASVAVVTDNSVFAVGPGEAEILGEVQGVSLAWSLLVAPPVSLRIDQPPAGVAVGEVVQLALVIDGQEVPISWRSSNPTIAEVSDDGEVSGLRAGVVYVTASSGSASAMTELTVDEP